MSSRQRVFSGQLWKTISFLHNSYTKGKVTFGKEKKISKTKPTLLPISYSFFIFCPLMALYTFRFWNGFIQKYKNTINQTVLVFLSWWNHSKSLGKNLCSEEATLHAVLRDLSILERST